MIDKNILEDVLIMASSYGGDYAEIFVEDRYNSGMKMIGGILENSLSGRDFGVGIRIFKGLNSVYTYTNNPKRDNLLKIAKEAALSLSDVPNDLAIDLVKQNYDNINPIKIYPQSVLKTDKLELLRQANQTAQASSQILDQVVINLTDHDQNVLIAATDGTFVEDRRTRTRFMVSAVANRNGDVQTGIAAKGAQLGYELFEQYSIETITKEAVKMAEKMAGAEYAPSGKFPVVIDNAFGGVIFHEACGHGLEATSVAKGNSVFCDKIGEKVASEIVTAVDDGTISNRWGSINVDDEGTKSQRNVLIENGILKGYMVDKLNGRRMNMTPTGSARRESYKYAPTSRMTNTYILEGNSKFEDMIASVEYGLYAKKLGGGSVNTATGEFNFSVNEGYLIENGKIKHPVKGATLIGTGSEVLNKIDMINDNFDSSEGMCGSVSGAIPVCIGQPALRVSEMTVGGREVKNV